MTPTPTKDLEGIESGLRRAQGENLIKAQQAYSAKNTAKFSFETTQNKPGGNRSDNSIALNYDTGAAQQQWAKLEQAQELGVVNAQPLRANLPTRGMQHVFTQVLQTEINKPMTIQLAATSTKAMSWAGRVLLPLAGFLALWLIVALLPKRREPESQPA